MNRITMISSWRKSTRKSSGRFFAAFAAVPETDKNRRETDASHAHIYNHVTCRLKVKLEADDAVKPHREIFFYENGKVFTARLILGLNPGENDFCCRWVPMEPGGQTLKANGCGRR